MGQVTKLKRNNFHVFFSDYILYIIKVSEAHKPFQCKIIISMPKAKCIILQFIKFDTIVQKKNSENHSDEYKTS